MAQTKRVYEIKPLFEFSPGDQRRDQGPLPGGPELGLWMLTKTSRV
jgi:hypothetical protein